MSTVTETRVFPQRGVPRAARPGYVRKTALAHGTPVQIDERSTRSNDPLDGLAHHRRSTRSVERSSGRSLSALSESVRRGFQRSCECSSERFATHLSGCCTRCVVSASKRVVMRGVEHSSAAPLLAPLIAFDMGIPNSVGAGRNSGLHSPPRNAGGEWPRRGWTWEALVRALKSTAKIPRRIRLRFHRASERVIHAPAKPGA